MGPVGWHAAQPMPGDLHQTLVRSLPQNGAILPPEGLSPSLGDMVFVGGGSCGATLLVPWKAGTAPPPDNLGTALYFVS